MKMIPKTKKGVLITGPGFEDPEVILPLQLLSDAEISVDIATVGKLPATDIDVTGKQGATVKPTTEIRNLRVDKYDFVVIPGGYEAPDRMRQNKKVLTFVRNMYRAGKLVSSTCHGPWVLISAGIMRGKKATCYAGMRDDLMNAGAKYRATAVVRDGNIITSDHPRNVTVWIKKTISWLQKSNFPHDTTLIPL